MSPPVTQTQCERCGGPGERKATTGSFELRERSVRCITYVSSCFVCGFVWDDGSYSVDNALELERARELPQASKGG